MNTEINAGPLGRRNSSNPRGSTSRRQSSVDQEYQDKTGSPRLQWDEANLYLNEGQMGGKMKIDEPKTPFVHGQDNPMDEDEDEDIPTIDPDHIVVDELDKAKVLEGEAPTSQQKRPSANDIPDLDLGEPEQDVVMERRPSDGEKKVIVAPADPDAMDIEDTGRHGEGREEDMPADEVAKHKKFEQMRKRHYEMSNVKGMLGYVRLTAICHVPPLTYFTDIRKNRWKRTSRLSMSVQPPSTRIRGMKMKSSHQTQRSNVGVAAVAYLALSS